MLTPDRSSPAAQFQPRMPLVWVTLFAAVGILFDRIAAPPLEWVLPMTLLCFSAGIALSLRKKATATLLILMGVSCLFAAWHRVQRNVYRSDEIALRVSEEATPVMLRAQVVGHVSQVMIRPSGLTTIPGGPQTKFRVRVSHVRDGDTWRTVSGVCRVVVKGCLDHVGPGDFLRIVGRIERPSGRMNPGGFSRFERARVDRTLTRLVANHPACVTVEQRSHALDPRYWLARYRTSAVQTLLHYLGQNHGELAAAIILGAREYLEPTRVDAFFLTGTIHLLAISGLHVGILAWGLFFLVRLSLVPRHWALISIMLLSVAYAALTGARAPVMRATILVILICGQLLLYKRPVSFNGLAAAALVVLAWNPMQLYQVGAQLSFLAVAALIWARPLLVSATPTDPLDRLIQKHETVWESVRRTLFAKLRTVAFVSLVVWATTLPLVMYRFHVVAPLALLLNLILWIPIGISLFLGFGILLFANVAPWLAAACAAGCAACLGGMESLVQFGSSIDGSYFWTVGPGVLVVCLFYLLVVIGTSIATLRQRMKWWAPAAAMLVGFATYANSRQPQLPELSCTFLSLGYGTSVVLQLPNGDVWLYDAGALGSPKTTVNEISSYLWNQGIGKLNGLVISHADADHYNAVPGLLERFAVDVVCISPSMMNCIDQLPVALSQAIAAPNRELRILEAGNHWSTEHGVNISILHPPAMSRFTDDNANSIVLLIEYCGRRILLPGDLERDGMLDLLSQQRIDCDVVLAPHHGSQHAMPIEFCRWCRPEFVVISGGQIDRANEIKGRFDGTAARVLHTAIDGFVQAKISPHDLSISTWRDGGDNPFHQ